MDCVDRIHFNPSLRRYLMDFCSRAGLKTTRTSVGKLRWHISLLQTSAFNATLMNSSNDFLMNCVS